MWRIIGNGVLKAFDGNAPTDVIPMKALAELDKDNIAVHVFGEVFVFTAGSTSVIITEYIQDTNIAGYTRDLLEYNNKVFCCFHKTSVKCTARGYTFYF